MFIFICDFKKLHQDLHILLKGSILIIQYFKICIQMLFLQINNS